MIPAIVMSLLSGITIVVARSMNAGLAQATSSVVSTLYNYLLGLPSAVVALLIALAFGGAGIGAQFGAVPVWAYLGGAMGALIVLISNIVTVRISSFYMTLLLFLGQVAAGIALDALLGETISPGVLLGGVAVAAGLTMNMMADKPASPGKPV